MARHDKHIVNLGALDTSSGKLGLIGYLWLVLIKVLWQVYDRLLYQLKVARTAHDYSQGYRLVGLSLGLVELGSDIKLTHSTRERCGALW